MERNYTVGQNSLPKLNTKGRLKIDTTTQYLLIVAPSFLTMVTLIWIAFTKYRKHKSAMCWGWVKQRNNAKMWIINPFDDYGA